MNKHTGLIALLFIFSLHSYSQWKPLTHPGSHQYENTIRLEINPDENKTRVTHLGSGKREILDCLVQDCRIVGDFLCLRILNVLNEEKTEVIFRVYRTPGDRFLREIHLSRKTYDYTKVESGIVFSPHATFPNGKALFFVLHEDCEWMPVGEKATVYSGENLNQEKVIPLPDRKLALWINDDATELTTVTGEKRVIQRSLSTGEIIWELDPDNFTCNWFNYAPQLLLNHYLCIEGIKDRGSMFSYYFVDMNTGKILDTRFSNEKIDRLARIDHCKNLPGGAPEK